MKIRFSPKFESSFRRLPKEIKDKFYKRAGFLRQDLKHPSLRAKKYDETRDIWQARVDKSYRFYFLISGDTYILLDIKAHPK